MKRVLLCVVVGVVLFSLGFASHGWLVKPDALGVTSSAHSKYPLLSRGVVSSPNQKIINFEPLREQLGSYVQHNNLQGSLYFQYLPTGVSVNVDGDTKEVAASLLKLPAAMDAYRAVETGKITLDKQITLQPSMLDSGYGDLYQKGAGYKLTLGDAIQIMLEQSDNTALKAVGTTTLGMVPSAKSSLNAVDISLTQNPDLSVNISARSYSSFLSCLYYSCYDTTADSEAILDDLSHTDFNNRLLAGIPGGVKVAHKIGVHDTDQSDCGIVYVPNKPYLACIFLDGDDDATTNGQIAALSKLIYTYVNQQ